MTTTYLTLEIAEQITNRTRSRRYLSWINRRLIECCVVLVSFFLVYVVLSAPAQYDRLVYYFSKWLATPNNISTNITNLSSIDTFQPSQFLKLATPIETVVAPTVAEGHLIIPSINVDAPIIWDVPIKDALNGLQRGVVHVRESYLPGEVGRTFIVGHSSGYWWQNNPWTKVFSLLENTANGDYVFLKKDSKIFAYKITKSEVVSPKDVQVIQDAQLDHNQLALMTCTPVGTSLNRFVVYAEPIAIATESGTTR